VCAYPTEAVWGLGADPYNASAVSRILELKKRPVAKGLILVGADIGSFKHLLQGLPKAQIEALENSWPGPNTWLVPHRGKIPAWVVGEHKTVAIRVSDHPVVKSLCKQVGGCIVSTSANPAGHRPAKTQVQARKYFGRRVIYCPGEIGTEVRPSTIRNLETGKILRA